MLSGCQDHIKNEISKASFVSVTADETTDVSSISQLVVVFRYVLSNGQPIEKFWEFTNPLRHDTKSMPKCFQQLKRYVILSPNQVKERSCFISDYSAVSLLEAPKFQEYEKTFPTQILDQTTDIYSMLQKDRLKTELRVIYSRSDFKNITGAISLLQFIIENSLQTKFPESYKLLLIIVTTPMTTAEAERCFSTLKRVQTFLRSTMSENRLSALAMLSIEKRMINGISKIQ
ncbi:hypothetical protein AVEN_89376-1 [Araneus ventricosus]|uniref:HAT C-terminal dimerisation domain-containing protein n=1 Tax=Araneus ventricosus TaxID=182803 RepID=A0A4Y2T6S1_ARAVE|nr:hypothetical protein AVEN_89376-1 [Araneus ventricosus]